MNKKRPFIAINMATSLDGKIATHKRGHTLMGSDFDRKRMGQIRAKADAVLMGANTFRVHPYPAWSSQKKQPATVVISSNLKFPPQTPWERAHSLERWVFCGKNASKAAINRLRSQGVGVVCARGIRPQPQVIVNTLVKAGFYDLLLEGGGEANGAFFEKDLVDRIYLTLCPLTIGGQGAPTLFEGRGFLKISQCPRWKLKEKFVRHGELYLTYDRFSLLPRRPSFI